MSSLDKKKILIADDESSLRTLINAVLSTEAEKYDVIEANDGNEALMQIENQRPDLVILDVMMPGLTGFEVCEKIKQDENLKNTIVLILTAKGQKTDQEWSQSVGADYFLSKPFSPLELLKVLDNLLASVTA